MILDEFQTLDKMMNEINRLKLGCQLLELLWLELGPYGNYGEDGNSLKGRINNFFKYNDNE